MQLLRILFASRYSFGTYPLNFSAKYLWTFQQNDDFTSGLISLYQISKMEQVQETVERSGLNSSKLVLVTGGTGFVGSRCILQLLQQGYKVRTTLRSLSRKDEVISMMNYGGIADASNLSFIETDLTSDKNWQAAADGCDYILHVASPLFLRLPKNDDELIVPAVQGTLRVLKAAREAKVKRVVLTSSFAAVGYSHKDPDTLITEESWTDGNDKSLSAYVRSKALAERAAWDFINNEGDGLELAVINPAAIFGPGLNKDLSGGFEIIKQMLTGKMRSLPNIYMGVVDVRDVAALHLKAMTNPAAKGQRFLALAGNDISFRDAAKILKDHFGEKAAKVSLKQIPDWLVRIAAVFSPRARMAVDQLGKIKTASNAKARRLLGWKPVSNEEAIIATGESLFEFELI